MADLNLDDWLLNLKPGSTVGVFDCNGTRYIQDQIVGHIDPCGKIHLRSGSLYNSDGSIHEGLTSNSRCLRPVGRFTAT